MEKAAELAEFLPISFPPPKEQEYIEFLWDTLETNYTNGKYRFTALFDAFVLAYKPDIT